MTRVIWLVGPRGSGKTTVGRLLAERLGRSFFDADTLICERAGRTVREIFDAEGEAGFRAREEAVIAELATMKDTVVATGGGAILREGNRRAMRESGRVVRLVADARTLWARMCADAATTATRPDLAGGGLGEVIAILEAREGMYAASAHASVETAGRTAAEVADACWAAMGHEFLRPS